MKDKILITGSNGFVGNQVVKYLANINANLKVVVRSKSNLKFNDMHTSIKSLITTADLFSETIEWWEDILQDVDTIIHLAWYTEPGKYLMSTKNKECLEGTINIAKAAIKNKVRRFVGIGTCFEYDLTQENLSIYTPLKPLTQYAEAKVNLFYALRDIFSEKNIEFTWCRLFYLFGEYEDDRRLAAYIKKQIINGQLVNLTNGNQIRDFLDVREAAKLISKVALSSICGPVNICSGKPVSIRDFSEKIADEYGRRDLLRFGVRQDNYIDPNIIVGINDYNL